MCINFYNLFFPDKPADTQHFIVLPGNLFKLNTVNYIILKPNVDNTFFLLIIMYYNVILHIMYMFDDGL